jgi:uncharacterized protein
MISEEDRRALVTYIVKTVGDTKPIGKKAAQKFVHLVEDAARVPTGFDFTIYTYGPFSRTLSSEIDALASSRAIDVFFNQQRSSFEISPGENANNQIGLGSGYINENKQKIDALLSKLKGKSGLELELYSTLVFLIRHVENMNTDIDVIEQLLRLKPKYKRTEVDATLKEVKKLLSK